MTFAAWWSGKYAINKRISENTFDLLRDAYEQGAKDERVQCELRCAKTPVLVDGHHEYTALRVQEMMMAAVSMRSNNQN